MVAAADTANTVVADGIRLLGVLLGQLDIEVGTAEEVETVEEEESVETLCSSLAALIKVVTYPTQAACT